MQSESGTKKTVPPFQKSPPETVPVSGGFLILNFAKRSRNFAKFNEEFRMEFRRASGPQEKAAPEGAAWDEQKPDGSDQSASKRATFPVRPLGQAGLRASIFR